MADEIEEQPIEKVARQVETFVRITAELLEEIDGRLAFLPLHERADKERPSVQNARVLLSRLSSAGLLIAEEDELKEPDDG